MRRITISGRRLGPVLAAALLVVTGAATSIAGEPRLDQIQVIGTHNSYHVAPAPAILEWLSGLSRRQAEGLDYTHPPLADQFARLGIRQIELDVFADPKGGLFAEPALRKIVRNKDKDPGPDPNADGRLLKPGLKVLHVQDLDFISRAPTFVEALSQVRAWSRSNPRHVPLMILVELKDGAITGLPTRPVKFGRDELDAVDAEILSVFDRAEILTPDRARGDSATLSEAIRSRGWPELDAIRGLVMFALDNEGDIRDRYIEGHPALRDRMMFVTASRPTAPEAAWFKVNDPIKDFDRIQQLVRDGFLVRTRADADTRQSRANDGTQRDKALASGAQFVSTDYPEPDRRFSDYRVRLPGDVVARANPISGNPTRGTIDLESGKGDQVGDTKALEGVWIPAEAELAGEPMPEAVLKSITLKVSQGEYEVSVEGEPEPDRGTFTLDPASEPKGMRITGVKGPNSGKTFLAIYELKADALRVCYDLSGAKRPTEFKTSPGTQLYLVIYKRKKT
jgi:uncharacterized protein (TIGR03067 family)